MATSSHTTITAVPSPHSRTPADEKAAGPNDAEFTKDFGIIPIPRRLRYYPGKTFHFGLLLNIAFGFASTFSECPHTVSHNKTY